MFYSRFTCFNPRARDGRDTNNDRSRQQRPRFNPRARDGRDTGAQSKASPSTCFNPRARDGRDHSWSTLWPRQSCFNPRARDGRDQWSYVFYSRFTCFNPRARDGRDVDNGGWRHGAIQVSIRAPVMGATPAQFLVVRRPLVSIRAPVMGATQMALTVSGRSTRFNPRARDGRDLRGRVFSHTCTGFQSARP